MSVPAAAMPAQAEGAKVPGALTAIRLIREADLSSTAKLVLLIIASHVDNHTLSASLYADTLAREAGLSRRAIQRWLTELEDMGMLERDPDTDHGQPGRRPTRTKIDLGALARERCEPRAQPDRNHVHTGDVQDVHTELPFPAAPPQNSPGMKMEEDARRVARGRARVFSSLSEQERDTTEGLAAWCAGFTSLERPEREIALDLAPYVIQKGAAACWGVLRSMKECNDGSPEMRPHPGMLFTQIRDLPDIDRRRRAGAVPDMEVRAGLDDLAARKTGWQDGIDLSRQWLERAMPDLARNCDIDELLRGDIMVRMRTSADKNLYWNLEGAVARFLPHCATRAVGRWPWTAGDTPEDVLIAFIEADCARSEEDAKKKRGA